MAYNKYTTLFAPEDKNLLGFQSIKWLIQKSKIRETKTCESKGEEKEYYNICRVCNREYKGTIPYHMYQNIIELVKHGYRGNNGALLAINWFSDEGRKHHTVKCRFGEYNSNANRIYFRYEISHYDQSVETILFPEA